MPDFVWANVLLSDGKILFWWTGSECLSIYDFCKDFYYSGMNMTDYEKSHNLELQKKQFRCVTSDENRRIFKELAPEFYRQFEISPDSKGPRPY